MPRVTISVPDTSPQPYRFQLDRQVVTLGRGSNNDIVIDCGSVSGSHAEMRRIEGGFELRDLNSTNGIKLAGERMPVIPLHNGLCVKLGDVTFDFELGDEERKALAGEKPAAEPPSLRKPGNGPGGKAAPMMPQADEARNKRGTVIWFLIFVLVAFCIGMAIRYQKETGNSWIQAVKTRFLGNSGAGKDGK